MTTKPADHFTVKIAEGERTIFMSYGLLNHLATMVQSPEVIAAVQLDPELRGEFLKALFAERTIGGKIITPVEDPDELEVSVEGVEAVLAWAMDHTMGFFIRALQRAEALTRRYEPQMKALVSTSDGSKD